MIALSNMIPNQGDSPQQQYELLINQKNSDIFAVYESLYLQVATALMDIDTKKKMLRSHEEE